MADVDFWLSVCARYEWAACPLLFSVHDDLVTDNPATAALNAAATRSISVGIPHPQHGVMRATMMVTAADTLTHLTCIAHACSRHAYATAKGMPHLYVATVPVADRVDGRCRAVLGVLAFHKAGGGGVHLSPLALVRHNGAWLPYFEDTNGWVFTGWDADGRAHEIHKPLGWGGRVLDLLDTHDHRLPHAHRASTAASRNDPQARVGVSSSSSSPGTPQS